MNGKVPVRILRVLAVVSALAIGGTYVAWKKAEGENAKERQRLKQAKSVEEKEMESDETILIVGSKSIGQPVFSKRVTGEELDSALKLLNEYGEPVNPVDGDSELPGAVEEEEPVLLPSSKIGIIVIPKIIERKEESEESPNKLLPGSKSSLFFREDPEPEKPE